MTLKTCLSLRPSIWIPRRRESRSTPESVALSPSRRACHMAGETWTVPTITIEFFGTTWLAPELAARRYERVLGKTHG